MPQQCHDSVTAVPGKCHGSGVSILNMLKPQVDEEMSGALSVAVQTLLQTFAQTHGGDGLTLSLACFNLYTVNQLALVCSEWHALVGIYDSHPAVGVVFSLFLFAAQRWSHRSLLEKSGRRSELEELSSGFELAIGSTNFSDHAFGKMAAIALGMYRWRPQKNLWSRNIGDLSGPQLQVCQMPSGRVKEIIGDWFFFWKPRFLTPGQSFLKLGHAASATSLTPSSRTRMSLRKCKSLEELEELY